MKKLLLAIIVLLFILPFFWFKPGEVNLGGDSSRLYFYQPIQFLKNFSLYSIIPSEIGQETITYDFIPFSILLGFLKLLLRSSYLLIVVFYSFMMSLSFMGIYLIVLELFRSDRLDKENDTYLKFAAMLAGLFYTLNPVVGFNWDKNLITHNQIFLNPIIFYLLLRFIIFRKDIYAILALLITFAFSPNFGFSSAPPFFAFYSLTVVFLLIYNKYVRNADLPVKKLILFLIFFISIHAFYYVPQTINFLDQSTNSFERVFSKTESTNSVVYFNSVRSFIKLVNNIPALPQNTKPLFIFDFLMFALPFTMVVALIANSPFAMRSCIKNKTFSLIFLFLLATLFFASGGVTPIGLNIYQFLFKIPGFSMFRNFFGQFMYVFFFFYSLALGYGIYVSSSLLKEKRRNFLLIFVAMLLIANSWSFINGTLVNQPFYQGEKDVDGTFKYDKEFDKVLDFFRNDPIDGKVLVLPLTDYGYQVLAGEGGYYLGPSMIGYLTGKKDFAGYPSFGDYSGDLLRYIKEKNYEEVKRIFAIYNIRYVFYNSDERIYSKKFFPFFPFDQARKSLPKSQEEYLTMINNLGLTLKEKISDKYYIFEVEQINYLPHIYATSAMTYSNAGKISSIAFKKDQEKNRIAIYYPEDFSVKDPKFFSDIILEAENKSQYFDFFKIRKPSKYPSPFVSQVPSSPFYPLVVFREKKSIEGSKQELDKFFDLILFYAEKRINELQKWGESIKIYGNLEDLDSLRESWDEPKYWEFYKAQKYNYWETSLLRYQELIYELIEKIEHPQNSLYPVITNKVALKKELFRQKYIISGIIRGGNRTYKEKVYLFNLVRLTYNSLAERLDIQIPNTSFIDYSLDIPIDGEYEVYVEKTPMEGFGLENINLSINGQSILPNHENSINKEWIRYSNMTLSKQQNVKIALKFQKENNIAKDSTPWKSLEHVMTDSDAASLIIEKTELEKTNGLVKEITNWDQDSFYVFSLEYNTYGKPFLLDMYEQENVSKSLEVSRLLGEQIKSDTWKEFKEIIPSSANELPRLLQIQKAKSDIYDEYEETSQSSKIGIRNLSVIQIPHPKLILRRINENRGQIPKIKFTKINPTKYKIEVKGMDNPFTLVFLEAFNSRWKLFYPVPERKTESLRGFISRFIGSIGRSFFSFFIEESRSSTKDKATEYFDGEVLEGIHKNEFISPATFETWGINSFADKIGDTRHFRINGYANAWYITPADVGGEKNYTLVLEMRTQKIFYASSLVSVFSLVVVMTLLAKNLKTLRRD